MHTRSKVEIFWESFFEGWLLLWSLPSGGQVGAVSTITIQFKDQFGSRRLPSCDVILTANK
jgi:hypothetical protein